MRRIDGVDDLEDVVGSPPLAIMMKSIPALDEHCAAILQLASVAVVGYSDASGALRSTLVGGAAGFATPSGTSELALPLPADAADGAAVSTLFLVPGWREALRINGHLDGARRDAFVVDEALLHCGKAVLRSKLWRQSAQQADPGATASPAALLAACPFVVLTSADPQHGPDTSPKGDPPGFVRHVDDSTVAIPDRRGNRRTDTLHNLMADDRVALLGLVPGLDHTLEVSGRAAVTDDRELLESMAMGGKTPKTAILVTIERAEVVASPALAQSRLWDVAPDAEPQLPVAGQIWADHIGASEAKGVKAAAIRSGAKGSVVQAGTELDYKRLY